MQGSCQDHYPPCTLKQKYILMKQNINPLNREILRHPINPTKSNTFDHTRTHRNNPIRYPIHSIIDHHIKTTKDKYIIMRKTTHIPMPMDIAQWHNLQPKKTPTKRTISLYWPKHHTTEHKYNTHILYQQSHRTYNGNGEKNFVGWVGWFSSYYYYYYYSGNVTKVSMCSQTQHPLYKSLNQKQEKTATMATMQKFSGSLQVCACGFSVCKTKQTYWTMSHTLMFNHAPMEQMIYDKKIQMSRSKSRGYPNCHIVNQTIIMTDKIFLWPARGANKFHRDLLRQCVQQSSCEDG